MVQSNLEEIQLGRLAEAKSTTGTVDEFAQRMVVDHSRAENRLDHLASDLHITSETENAANPAADERLSKLPGQAFDSAYVRDVLRDHQRDIATARYEEKNGEDPALRQYAASILPVLEYNLEVPQSDFHSFRPRPWQAVENNEFVPFSAAGK